MNIFFVNYDPKVTAFEHNSVHLRKMIVEYAQMLSTAHHLYDSPVKDLVYKPTHKNHPSAIWVRQSADHYLWLLECLTWMLFIYYQKYGKHHKTSDILIHFKTIPNGIPYSGFKVPPLACNKLEYADLHEMLESGKIDITTAYQKYLNHKLSTWLAREKPIKFEWPVYQPNWYQNI